MDISVLIRKIKVGARLGVAFGIVVLLLLAVSATAAYKIRSINEAVDQIVSERYLKVRLAFEVKDGLAEQINFSHGLVIDTGKAKREKEHLAGMEAAARRTREAIARIDANQFTEVGRKRARDLKEAESRFSLALKEVTALVSDGNAAAAQEAVLRTLMAPQRAFQETANSFVEAQDHQLRMAGDKALADGAAAIRMVLLFSAVALLIAIGLGYLLTRSIVRPLSEAVRVARRVSEGDLGSRIAVSSGDEAGQLMLALQSMNDSLCRIVGDVRSGTDAIAATSGEIANGNLDLSARTEQQAGSIEETASAIEQLTSTVRQNSDHAQQANRLAGAASGIARQGGEVMARVVSTMSDIHASSQKVVEIISVIDGIAFQTNILALNAAVEAARAGEQGRGFAVVASEVRSLAQRSAAAAREIKQLIDDSVGKVADGSRLVSQAGATMEEVVASVAQVTTIVGDISGASLEQSAGIEEINRAITQMDVVTQQNAALVEQAAAAAESMREQADRLSSAVLVFKLPTHVTAPDVQVIAMERSLPALPGIHKHG